MRPRATRIAGIILIAILVVCVVVPLAHAQTSGAAGSAPSIGSMWSALGSGPFNFLGLIIANLAVLALTITGFILTIAGFCLNFTITLTLNIKSFVDSTPAIYTTWVAVRDIANIFIIFALLVAAFQLILDLKGSSFNKLIKDIVIAGALVNFSFFLAGLGIDASNIVSVQLYNAIAPQQSLNAGNATTALSQGTVDSIFTSGGISDIFMKSLRITSIYDHSLAPTVSSSISTLMRVTLASLVGIVIELIAAASFFAASIAFIIRFVVLLLLLAFSPIWFISQVVPRIGEYATKWKKWYFNMLLFMPVYLLLMYFALNVLTTSPLFSAGVGTTSTMWGAGLMSFAVNAALVTFMLNIPLLAAASIGGLSILEKAQKSFSASAIWKTVGSGIGRNTLGLSASKLNDSRMARNIYASNPLIGRIASGQLDKVSSAGFGGGKKASYDEVRKKKIESYKKLAERVNFNKDEQERIKDDALRNNAEVKGHIEDSARHKARAEDLKEQKKSLVGEMNSVSRQLKAAATDADKVGLAAQMEALKAQIGQLNDEASESQTKANESKKKADDIIEEKQNAPKNALADRLSGKQTIRRTILKTATAGNFGRGSSKFYRDVGRAIKLKKDKGDEIMDAIKGIKSEGGGGGGGESKK